MKRLFALWLALLLMAALGACSRKAPPTASSEEAARQGEASSYKPPVPAEGDPLQNREMFLEDAEIYRKISETYRRETGRTLSAIAATSDGFEEMPDLFPETKELLVALPVRTSVGLAPELRADPKTLLNGAAALCAPRGRSRSPRAP